MYCNAMPTYRFDQSGNVDCVTRDVNAENNRNKVCTNNNELKVKVLFCVLFVVIYICCIIISQCIVELYPDANP